LKNPQLLTRTIRNPVRLQFLAPQRSARGMKMPFARTIQKASLLFSTTLLERKLNLKDMFGFLIKKRKQKNLVQSLHAHLLGARLNLLRSHQVQTTLLTTKFQTSDKTKILSTLFNT
jgi:hypothetical protein